VCVYSSLCVCVLDLQGPTYTDMTGDDEEIVRLQLEILSYKQGRAELVLLQKQQQLAKKQQQDKDRH
jgi:hypothetical protein